MRVEAMERRRFIRMKRQRAWLHISKETRHISYATRLDGILLFVSPLQISASTIVHSSVFPITEVLSALLFFLFPFFRVPGTGYRTSPCLFEGKLGFICVTIGSTNIPRAFCVVV